MLQKMLIFHRSATLQRMLNAAGLLQPFFEKKKTLLVLFHNSFILIVFPASSLSFLTRHIFFASSPVTFQQQFFDEQVGKVPYEAVLNHGRNRQRKTPRRDWCT